MNGQCAAHRKGKKAHFILVGDAHLVVVEGDRALRDCPPAAAEILGLAQEDLDRLRQQLGI